MSNIIKYNKQQQKQNNLKNEIYFEIQKIYSLIIILILIFDKKYNYILSKLNNQQINNNYIEYKKSKNKKHNKKNKNKRKEKINEKENDEKENDEKENDEKENDEKIRIEEKMEIILNLYFKRLIISYTILIIIIISFIIYLNYKLN